MNRNCIRREVDVYSDHLGLRRHIMPAQPALDGLPDPGPPSGASPVLIAKFAGRAAAIPRRADYGVPLYVYE